MRSQRHVSSVSTVFFIGSQQELGGFVELRYSAHGIRFVAQEGMSVDCASVVLIINNTIATINDTKMMILRPAIFLLLLFNEL